MKELLAGFGEDPKVLVLTNERNIGFPASVNLGFEQSDRDVVLLNSDTEVFPGWLESMVIAAACNTNAATVTPYSSNSGIFTLFPPEFSQKYDYQILAKAVNLLFDGSYLSVPTGNGFCMFVRRRALTEVGNFDAETFGKGYGEETDFCMRCRKAGMIHIVDPSCYVRLVGRASFGESAKDAISASRAILDQRYPEYTGLVNQFKQSANWTRKKQLLLTRVEKYLKVTGLDKGRSEETVEEQMAEKRLLIAMQPEDELSDETTTSRISALEIYGNVTLENLTVVVSNARYAVHDETLNDPQWNYRQHNYRNCTFIHEGNIEGGWESPAAYGAGTGDGCQYTFENCRFFSSTYYAWSMHNNENQNSGVQVIHDGSIMETGGSYSAKISYYGKNTTRSEIFLKDIITNAPIQIRIEKESVESDNIWDIYAPDTVDIQYE